jgi:predicted Na+-dependent transporter
MRKKHQKNTVLYFVIVIFALFILFFSGDFGTIDVQKTAIIMAVLFYFHTYNINIRIFR